MTVALAAALATQTAEVAGVEVARALFGVVQLIAESAENVRVNREYALALAGRISDFVSIVTLELAQDQTDEWFFALENFRMVLTDAYSMLQEQEESSYLAQLLYRERNAARLKDVSDRIRDGFSVLMLQSHMELHKLANATRLSDSEALAELDSNYVEASKKAAPPAYSDTSDGPRIPPEPQLFLGRAAETTLLANMLAGPSSSCRVAILGGPGMGKTTLALTALHAPPVVARFGSRRYFVSCDIADGQSSAGASCIKLVARSIGVFDNCRGKVMERKIAALLSREPSLLILDNFESAWEAPFQRADAEEALSFLGSIEGLSILVTLRGTERPHGVEWTLPHIPPLQSLDRNASLQLFLSHADLLTAEEGSSTLRKLVDPMDGVPLALMIMANLAQYESAASLYARWEHLKTALLTHGAHDRLSNLNVSITLSLESPRMTQVPEARNLLSMLALLPSGTCDSDVLQWSSDAPEARRAISTLLQTALAYRTPDSPSRIRVLSPIREFMLSQYLPSPDSLLPLYSHHFGLAELILHEGTENAAPDAIAAIAPEVNNIYYVIQHALTHSSDPRPALQASVCMASVLYRTGIGYFDLLPTALDVARQAHHDDKAADLLRWWGSMAYHTSISASRTPRDLWTEALTLYKRLGDQRGVIDVTLCLAPSLPPDDAARSCEEMRRAAETLGDEVLAARCDGAQGAAHERAGRNERARECRQAVIDRLRSLGDSTKPAHAHIMGYNMFAVADLLLDAGRVDEGVAGLQEAIPVLRAGHKHTGVGEARRRLGNILAERGDAIQAVQQFEAAARDFQMGNSVRGEVSCWQYAVSAHISLGDCTAAERAVERAEDGLRTLGDDVGTYDRARLLLSKGELALHRDRVEAEAILHAALTTARSRDTDKTQSSESMLFTEARALELIGQLAEPEEARRCFIVAALVFRIYSQTDSVRVLTRLAHVLDGNAARVLLDTVIPPLRRFGFKPVLATALSRRREIVQTL
ncbi:hypothetical protein EXIGLDRAFT_831204 [Exidia glandulosa HHB12029]|uniref:Uncharacterized protein n=1 Tax=Exidia glandulosa HHB12029 TaxID=1314781 RepID=A0A166BC58_EXIGL|nr:hypothetical protein EXIGLDRAFT_831204 [Exidia glandulosa HHB12029]